MSAVTPANGPGAQLQQRREAMGLSLQQAAAQLNLKAAVIEQLESQQWDARVGPTFIRGYLRQYCRLLKLDEAQMLSQFDQLLAALPQATPMHSFSKKTSRDAAESRFMLATYFLLVLLIGLFLIWFWQTHMLNDQPVSMLPELEHSAVSAVDSAVDVAPADIRSTEVKPPLPTVAPQQQVAVIQADSSAEVSQDRELQTEVTPLPQAQTETAPLPQAQMMSPAVIEAAEPPPAATPVPDSPQLTGSPVPDTPVDTLPATETASAAAAVSLQLQFSAQCWVAITDATGQRLAYSMQNSGQTLTVTGTAPLRVTLGDPAAVSATVQGNVIDLTGYKQGQVARLTITGSE